MSLLQALKEFAEGKIDKRTLENSDDDGLIRVDRVNQNNLGKSLVSLYFGNRDEYTKLVVGSDDHSNNEYYMNVALGSYYGYDSVFIDAGYFADEEWNEGYIYRNFNEENKDKFKNILKRINPKMHQKMVENEDDTEVYKFMSETFDRQISDISYEYASLYDDALVKGLRQYIEQKVCGKLDDYGIYEKTCGLRYYTTVNTLIRFWKVTGSDEDDDILEILKQFIQKYDLYIDEDLADDYYSYYSSENFDEEGFQRTVSRELERIDEKIDEMEEDGELSKNLEIYEKLQSLGYRLGEFYKLPKQKTFGEDPKTSFKVVDVTDGKLQVIERNNETYQSGKRIFSMEDFLYFLYHPTLFESKF